MIDIKPFALERYFAKHEFTAKYLLSSSDCESMTIADLLAMTNDGSRKLWSELKLGYTESQGHSLLRQEISGLYDDIGPDGVMVCTPEEGIFLIMQTILRPGDHVVATFPGYQSLYEIAQANGCQISKWEPDESTRWVFDLNHLENLLRPETRLVVVNFPHNPTGYVPKEKDFKLLVNLIRERGIFLFSDEMYRFLEFREGSTLPPACQLYEHAFSLFGMSKTFGLPGLRIGWIVSQDKESLGRLIELKDYTTICNSAPSEILSLIALQNRELLIQKQKERLISNLEFLDTFMKKFEYYFRWLKPTGGSICFPRMLNIKSTLDFCDRLVAETGIMLVPSQMFQYGDRHVRIGFGRENFKEVLTHFGLYLENLMGS